MSILAGMMIALGCILYLSIGGVTGAVMFSVGLMTVCLFQLKLFTGQAGKLSTGKIGWIDLTTIWAENAFGCFIIALIALALPNIESLREQAILIMQARERVGYFRSLILAIPCGMLMTFAVSAANEMKLVYIAFCVAAFIFGGFYHCVADMFYTMIGATNLHQWLNVFMVTIGNVVGCNLYGLLNRKLP